MFGTKRFGRNISNVQREYNPGKPVMKKDVDSSSNLFNVSQTNLTVHKRKPVKKAVLPQDKSKSYFDAMNNAVTPIKCNFFLLTKQLSRI